MSASTLIDSHVHVGRNRARWDETRPTLEALGIDTAVLAPDPESEQLDDERGLPGDLSRPGGPWALWYVGGNPFAGIRLGLAGVPRNLDDFQGIEWHGFFSDGFDYGGSEELAASAAVDLLRSEEGRVALEVLEAFVAAKRPVRLTENLPVTLALLERHPEATFIIPHMGLRNGGTSRVLNALAGNERVHFDTSVVDLNEGMVERVGARRVLFGSDAPDGDAARSLRAVRNLHLPAAAITAILGENARRLFAAD